MTTMAECPFCGRAEAKISHEHDVFDRARVWCPGCGALGPAYDSVKDAGEAWNSRSERKEFEALRLELTTALGLPKDARPEPGALQRALQRLDARLSVLEARWLPSKEKKQ